MTFSIAVSGACHSGKTTVINKLKDIFGDNAVIIGELVRDSGITSIDDIRSDGRRYLDFEKDYIARKIAAENDARDAGDVICLVDRSLADSYYYLTRFTDVSEFDDVYKNMFVDTCGFVRLTAKKHFEDFYDSVLLVPPIHVSGATDNFRPNALKPADQDKEFDEILFLTQEFLGGAPKSSVFDVTHSSLMSEFSAAIQENGLLASNFSKYSDYRRLVEGKYMVPNNIIMNTYGSVENNGFCNDFMNFAPLLFTEDKAASDKVVSMVKDVSTDENMMDSRCYPVGLWKPGNVMIVGEAPGQSGRAVRKDFLKPSFVFTRTSWILRMAIQKYWHDEYPYITNLLKFAKRGNVVNHEHFELTKYIFMRELEELKPRKIIALGNNVYNYLTGVLKIDCVKLRHPASVFYSGISVADYFNQFKEVCDA